MRLVSLQSIIITIVIITIVIHLTHLEPFVFAEEATPSATLAPTPTPDNSAAIQGLQSQINDLQNKISDLQGQEKTLSSQISVMDSQIKLTQLRINAAKEQITELTADISTTSKKITHLEGSLNDLTKVLLNRIAATYKIGSIQPLQILATSSNASNFFSRFNYLRIAQAHDKQLIYDTEQAKNDYKNQKQIFEGKQNQLIALNKQFETYTKQLDNEKTSKKRLLDETQGSEANYQRLLSQAEAQLAGFSRFTSSQGGASILTNQTVCDDWGCYYNQRDSQWGSTALNHTQFTIASDGCLVTSMAMIYTHYGYKSVTPLTINSRSENFASYYPAWLKYDIEADGSASNRVRDSIDNNLSSGNPVVVGISYDGGPIADHFVVLISGSGGNYQMNDPFTPGGHNIAFASKYSAGSIREIYKVIF